MDDSGNRKEFPGGGMRDTAEGKERYELLWTSDQPYEDQMLTRAARWMARGAEKYESRNWEQFSGDEALEHAKASLLRHVFKLLAGQTDEDHAAAVWFNVQAIELIRWKQVLQEKVSTEALKAAYDAADSVTVSVDPGSLLTPIQLAKVRGTVDPEAWCPGDLVEYDAYGSKFRGRLVEAPDDSSHCWRGVVTEIDSLGDNILEGLRPGDTVSFVEGHSTRIRGVEETRFFREIADGIIYRWDGRVLTYRTGADDTWDQSGFDDPEDPEFTNGYAVEIPIGEVPEWAR